MELKYIQHIDLSPRHGSFFCLPVAEVSCLNTAAGKAPVEQVCLAAHECCAFASQIRECSSRLESGCLAEWPLWAQGHPDKDTSVRVHEGVEAGTLHRSTSSLSIVSWNVLSPFCLARAQRGNREGKHAAPSEGFTSWGYPYVKPETGSWDVRGSRIVAWLCALSPDIISLQEVDKDIFEESLAKPLARAGYEGLLQKVAENHPYGVATFWRSNLLQKTKENLKGSSSIITCFRVREGAAEGTEVVVINTHLRAGQGEEPTRAGQLHNSLRRAASDCPGAALIVAGDFNSGPDTRLAEVLRSYRWYGYGLAAAYEHPAAEQTSPVTDCTFAADGGRFMLDHLYYEHSRLRLRALLQPLIEPARTQCLGPGSPGLPDTNVPSDHIPIGAIWQILPAVNR